MNAGRLALIATCVVVSGFTVWFAVANWDQANRVAAITSAVGAVAAVGVAVWAAMRGSGARRSVTVTDTGRATAGPGGQAITGVTGKLSETVESVRVRRTGNARTSGDGDAVTGAQLD